MMVETGRRVAVALLGARMHYAVPRILQTAGRLERFFTDICATKGWPSLLRPFPRVWMPRGLRRLAERDPVGIPRRRVTAFTGFGLEYLRRRSAARSLTDTTEAYLWAGRVFGDLVVREGFGDAGAVFTFNSAGLEILREARERGLAAVMEQTIAPREIEDEILDGERARFPEWESGRERDVLAAAFAERERSEWDEADLILCGSEFVKDGVVKCGGSAARCVVVPYGVSASSTLVDRAGRSGPLRVLTVGAVGIRKGSPYVLEAAKRLKARAIFRMVGPFNVPPRLVSELRRHVELTGPVERSAVLEHYAWADAFLLPSLCEGSATATYEALAQGLPVICTPNTGSLVRDGVDGFVVPVRDADAVVSRIESMISDVAMRSRMASAALARSATGSIEAYAERLISVLRPACAGSSNDHVGGGRGDAV